MRKFWLNLIEIITWVYQVICILGMVVIVSSTAAIAILGEGDSEFAQGFRAGFGVTANSKVIYLILAILILSIVQVLAEFLICKFARNLVKNIKGEVYFANQNVELIRKLLIWVATYTLVTILSYGIAAITYKMVKVNTQDWLYPSSAITGLLFLAVIYVIYLVFKYGMQLQEDSDAII